MNKNFGVKYEQTLNKGNFSILRGVFTAKAHIPISLFNSNDNLKNKIYKFVNHTLLFAIIKGRISPPYFLFILSFTL